MTVRDVLLTWGFRNAGESPGELYMPLDAVHLSVTLRPDGTTVSCAGAFFSGCEYVRDLRQLIRLLNPELFLAGDKVYGEVRSPAERDEYDRDQPRWHHAYSLELKLDGRQSWEPGKG